MQISVCKLVGESQSIVTIWDHLFYFFHVLNGFSLLWLTTTAEISLSHKFRRANTILWALSLSEAFNNAIQLHVFSAYQLSQGTLKKMKSVLLKPKKNYVLKGRKLELHSDSQTQGSEVSIVSITELCLHCVWFSALLLVPFQGHELYNCGTHIIII